MPRRLWPVAAAALLLAGCIENRAVDDSKLRQVTEMHFGSARYPIEAGPVVVSGNHAIVDWTQGEFGGRALYERYGAGWMLLLCSGDSIRAPDNLKRAGVPDFNADQLATELAKAEAALSPERLSRMKRFVGTAADHERYLKSLEAQ